MAEPLNTIPNWVPNIDNPTILFITENYPKDPDDRLNNTYFYRSLNAQIELKGSNNLLNNLCRTLNIIGETETEKLNNFLFERNYFLIDTFPSGQPISEQLINLTINNIEWIDTILDDLVHINPQQIVLTCVGSNGRLLPLLINRAEQRGLQILDAFVQNPLRNNETLFFSPSNRAYSTFNMQIDSALNQNLLFLGRPIRNEFNNLIQISNNDVKGVFNWDDTNLLANELNNGWRLPTIQEILEIYNQREVLNFANYGFWGYWTSEENVEEGYCFGGPNGEIYTTNKESEFYVRLVRELE
jgi:hypothetical protein